MKPRKMKFKQDNRLRFCFTKDNVEFGSDFMGILPKGERGRWDLYLLFNIFLHRPIADKVWDKEKRKFIEQPTFIEELEKRGYDKTIIYFEIEKKKEQNND